MIADMVTMADNHYHGWCGWLLYCESAITKHHHDWGWSHGKIKMQHLQLPMGASNIYQTVKRLQLTSIHNHAPLPLTVINQTMNTTTPDSSSFNHHHNHHHLKLSLLWVYDARNFEAQCLCLQKLIFFAWFGPIARLRFVTVLHLVMLWRLGVHLVILRPLTMSLVIPWPYPLNVNAAINWPS